MLFYLYACLKSISRKTKVKLVSEEDIDIVEIEELIKQSQNDFKNKELMKTRGFGNNLIIITRDLCNAIASKYYPSSKYPYLELTIDETIIVAHHIIDVLDKILQSKILRLFRTMTIKQIYAIVNTKSKLDKSGVTTLAVSGNKVFSTFKKALNIINPVYWFKKLTFDVIVKTITKKIALVFIKIAGTESYYVYSKKQFNPEDDTDAFVKEFEKSLNEKDGYDEE
ncbi:MAG: hypothetical protein LBV51_02525 [Acholeplasmatales bacterium]|jgi:hypothetical protein|nr:hypothetical protein [Acholeplasmatales bacterium]